MTQHPTWGSLCTTSQVLCLVKLLLVPVIIMFFVLAATFTGEFRL